MHESEKWKWSSSVVSDPSRPHGLQPTRLLCPWDFPGKSNGVGCHCLLHQCSLVGHNSGCLLDSPGGTSLVVQWLGLYASTVDGGGGVTSVCSLIWELVSCTRLSVVKENRITWGTLKNSHSPQQQQQKMLSSSPRNVNDISLSAGPRIFFSQGLQVIPMGSQRREIFPSECHCNNPGAAVWMLVSCSGVTARILSSFCGACLV